MSWFWVIAMSLYERQLWLCTLSTPLCICNSARLTVSVLVELYTVRVNRLSTALWRMGFLSAACQRATECLRLSPLRF